MSSLVILCSLSLLGSPASSTQEALRSALTFHAGFDGTTSADFSHGDAHLYTTLTGNTEDGKVGLHRDDVKLFVGAGRFGDALHFRDKSKALVYYQAKDNVYYRIKNWGGTISMWLSLDPERDLQPGYCDPIMITDKKWNDASLWVDFSKDEKPRHFRLGVMSDQKVWNPKGLKWDDIPANERPLVTVTKPPFRSGKWTHVVITFDRFNNDSRAGRARLYLNGELQGEVAGRQVFSWSKSKATIRLGINYIGLVDDLAIFSRALSAEEVTSLYRLRGGVAALGAKR